jgi:hypothetical protein
LKLGETELRTRAGAIADRVAIAEIYNQGIADRIATFEIEPRSAADIAKWFTQQHLVMVSETTETGRSLLRFFPLQQPGLLQRHWRILGLCQAGLSRTWRRPCRARCVNRSGG